MLSCLNKSSRWPAEALVLAHGCAAKHGSTTQTFNVKTPPSSLFSPLKAKLLHSSPSQKASLTSGLAVSARSSDGDFPRLRAEQGPARPWQNNSRPSTSGSAPSGKGGPKRREGERDGAKPGWTREERQEVGIGLTRKAKGSSGGEQAAEPGQRSTRVNSGPPGSRGQAPRAPRFSPGAQQADGSVERGDSASEPQGAANGAPRSRSKPRREPALREQVSFERPMSKDPEVAIVGGGISGIACALTLAEQGIRSTIFDTGKHGLGGRLATRHVVLKSAAGADANAGASGAGQQQLVFDHAAQYFTVGDARFQRLVSAWLDRGLLQEWRGPRPVWVSAMAPRRSRWALAEGTRPEGEFDAVVIAHNAGALPRLVRVAGGLLLLLLRGVREPLPVPSAAGGRRMEGAFVEGIPAVAWMANNSAKLAAGGDGARPAGPECWTVFSTNAYGKKNKVPQESIPVARAERVTADMLRGMEEALGLEPSSLPKPIYHRLISDISEPLSSERQLVNVWRPREGQEGVLGAALPLNAPGVDCIFDPIGRVGICGDWLLAPCVEGAVLSGMAMAKHIAKFRDECDENPEDFAVGLDTKFAKVTSHDIGAFPTGSGSCSREVASEAEVLAAA
eukprot:jgi/Mesen1/3602/ME000020S03132